MDTIELMVDRKKRYVPADTIRYVLVTDKLCKFYLKDDTAIAIFITIGEVERILPREEFVRISRSVIVAYSAILSIRDTVNLFNGEQLEYSIRRKKELQKGYQNYVERVLLSRKKNEFFEAGGNRFQKEYRCFDTMPIPFAVIELIVNADHQSTDFIFQYANKALSVLENIPLEKLLYHTFCGEVFHSRDTDWLEFYADVAFHGGCKEILHYNDVIKKTLRVQCFQPCYGYCGCILTDISEKVNREAKDKFLLSEIAV